MKIKKKINFFWIYILLVKVQILGLSKDWTKLRTSPDGPGLPPFAWENKEHEHDAQKALA